MSDFEMSNLEVVSQNLDQEKGVHQPIFKNILVNFFLLSRSSTCRRIKKKCVMDGLISS